MKKVFVGQATIIIIHIDYFCKMKKIMILMCMLVIASSISAQKLNLDKNKLAVQGYDVISYFSGKPLRGKEEFSYTYHDATYYFNNKYNLEAFKKSPEKFEPQYGGWCAYAMGANGEKVEVNPETFKIINGKLYLFYNAYFNNTLDKWNKDEARLKSNADKNWDKLAK